MKINRGYKFDLHPSGAQAAELRRVIGSTRLVYNLALEQRANQSHRLQVIRALGQNPTFKTQCVELTDLRREIDFLGAGPVAAQQQALKDVDSTFQRYFKGRKGEGPEIGFPSRRKKGLHDSFRVPGAEFTVRQLNSKWAVIKLPKVGDVKFRLTRPLPKCEAQTEIYADLQMQLSDAKAQRDQARTKGERDAAQKVVVKVQKALRNVTIMGGKARARIKNATVRLKAGRWTVSLSLEYQAADPAPVGRGERVVGIDRGVTIPLVTSAGEEYRLPNAIREGTEVVDGRARKKLSKLEKRKRRAQRTAARRRKWTRKPTHKSAGVMAARKDQSKRYWKAMREVERLDRKIVNIRHHWQHETTTRLARAHKLIAVEKLNTAGMTKSAKGTAEEPGKQVKPKSGLNRAILSVGWHSIESKLAYKLDEQSGALIKVPAKDSSRECAECGTVDPDNRKSQAVFKCQGCGHEANADHNAAAVIAARGEIAWKAAGGTPRQDKKGVESSGAGGRYGQRVPVAAEALTGRAAA